jgi:hypothetical protein
VLDVVLDRNVDLPKCSIDKPPWRQEHRIISSKTHERRRDQRQNRDR